ncbi:hypothetical protein BJ165DRAFT_358838 [Panaeolus papilionaceus]|nr:hypothetical protein BJ165DRAFT_358838 [Panaeolus papilionaceus]
MMNKKSSGGWVCSRKEGQIGCLEKVCTSFFYIASGLNGPKLVHRDGKVQNIFRIDLRVQMRIMAPTLCDQLPHRMYYSRQTPPWAVFSADTSERRKKPPSFCPLSFVPCHGKGPRFKNMSLATFVSSSSVGAAPPKYVISIVLWNLDCYGVRNTAMHRFCTPLHYDITNDTTKLYVPQLSCLRSTLFILR